MNILKRLASGLVPLVLCALTSSAVAQSVSSDATDTDSDHPVELHHRHHHHRDQDDEVMSVGSDAHLPAGSHADSVVSIFGSAISEGEAGQVVSVFGATRVTGPVTDDAVAVFGGNYIDSKVDGDAVAVFGDLELGPHAEIGGDVVSVAGSLTRDPAAIIHGEEHTVMASHLSAHFEWLRTWARHCLLYGRPLAVAPGLGWAWILALSFLALYVALALIFPAGISRCAQTFESQPGQSIIAAVIGVLLSPIVIILLCITVVGVAAVPFLLVGLLCASLFGKAIMLAWLGRRCLVRSKSGRSSHPALAVALGGAIVLVLYLVPVVGFLVYKLLALLGFGVVVLTLLQIARASRSGGTAIDATTTPASAAGSSTAAAPADAAAAGAATAGAAPAAAVDPMVADAAAMPASNAALPRAGFWIRMTALLLDVVLVGILLSILHHMANLELVVLAAYGAVMWKLRGATIGGIVFDLQVVRHDGREMDWATVIVRALGCFLSLAAAGLGFIWIAFDGGKQAWHDKIAGTVVVRTTKRISLV
jgi:uncharacterized RDD family membrane protein YckC